MALVAHFRELGPGFSRVDHVARWLVLAPAVLVALAALAALWLLAWLTAYSLIAFLAGPSAGLALDIVPWRLLVPATGIAAAASIAAGWPAARRWQLAWAARARGMANDATAPSTGSAGTRDPHHPSAREADLGEWPEWFALPRIVWLPAIAVAALAGLAFLRLSYLYHRIDPGADLAWPIYPARVALSGLVPYRDFSFPQGPLAPYVTGVMLAPVGFSENAARLVALAVLIATAVMAFLAARRAGGALAAFIAVALLAASPPFLGEVAASLRPDGVAALLATASALALLKTRFTVALVVAAVSVAVQPSLLPLLLALSAYVALVGGRPRLALVAGPGLAAVLFLPFILLGGESALWSLASGLLRANVQEQLAGIPPGVRYRLLELRHAALGLFVMYLPFVVAAAPAFFVVRPTRHPRWAELTALGAGLLGVLALGFAVYPFQARSVSPVLPLLAIVGGASVAAMLDWLRRQEPTMPAIAAVLLGAVLVAGILLGARTPPPEEEYGPAPAGENLARAARELRDLGGPSARLLALETPLASESGLRVVPGLEMGPWAIARNLPEERARILGLVAVPTLVRMVEQADADLLVESDRYGVIAVVAQSTDALRGRMKAAVNERWVLRKDLGEVSDWGRVRAYTPRPA